MSIWHLCQPYLFLFYLLHHMISGDDWILKCLNELESDHALHLWMQRLCVYLLTDGVRTGLSGVRSGGEKGSMTGCRSWWGTCEERDTKEQTCRDTGWKTKTHDFMTTVWAWHTNCEQESLLTLICILNINSHAVSLGFWKHCDQMHSNLLKPHKSPASHIL